MKTTPSRILIPALTLAATTLLIAQTAPPIPAGPGAPPKRQPEPPAQPVPTPAVPAPSPEIIPPTVTPAVPATPVVPLVPPTITTPAITVAAATVASTAAAVRIAVGKAIVDIVCFPIARAAAEIVDHPPHGKRQHQRDRGGQHERAHGEGEHDPVGRDERPEPGEIADALGGGAVLGALGDRLPGHGTSFG